MKQTLLLEMSKEDLQVLVIDSVNACLKNLAENDKSSKVPIEERYIDKKEAAKIAGVSSSTIDNYGRARKITRYYFGGSVRFWLPELLEFLRAHGVDRPTLKQSK